MSDSPLVVAGLIAKLPPMVQNLVQNASPNLPGNTAFGSSKSESKEVSDWLRLAADITSKADLESINTKLSWKTYLAASSPSAADIALFGVLHPIVTKLRPEEYYALPSITRFVDHIQNLPAVAGSPDAPTPIAFALSDAPKLERSAEASSKKKEKAAKGDLSATPANTPVPEARHTSQYAPEGVATAGSKAAKKDKRAPVAAGEDVGGKKSKGGGSAPVPASATDAGEPAPSMIDLRVGKIIQVARHPDADGLYVEQIDVGEESGPRTVVSGLVNYLPITELQDRTVIVVANLKPANMRGIKSFAMVLCATHKDGKEHGIEFVEPPPGSNPGERVFFDGDKYRDETPTPQLNPKKKVFETIQPGFTTLENRDAAWVNPSTGTPHRMITKDGPCRPKTFVGATLS